VAPELTVMLPFTLILYVVAEINSPLFTVRSPITEISYVLFTALFGAGKLFTTKFPKTNRLEERNVFTPKPITLPPVSVEKLFPKATVCPIPAIVFAILFEYANALLTLVFACGSIMAKTPPEKFIFSLF